MASFVLFPAFLAAWLILGAVVRRLRTGEFPDRRSGVILVATGVAAWFAAVFVWDRTTLDRDWTEPFWEGFQVTLRLALLAGLLGTGVAVVSGLAGLSPFRAVRWVNRVYVEFFRGTSAIIQLFWAFFALPLLGLELSAMEAAVWVLGLNMGAYGSEVVRGAVNGVSRGQYEASIALSVPPWKRMVWIIFPQAVPTMLPPYGNLTIEMLKATALVSTLGLGDVFFRAQQLRTAGEGAAQDLLLVALVIYFLIAQGVAGGVRLAERAASRGFEGTR